MRMRRCASLGLLRPASPVSPVSPFTSFATTSGLPVRQATKSTHTGLISIICLLLDWIVAAALIAVAVYGLFVAPQSTIQLDAVSMEKAALAAKVTK